MNLSYHEVIIASDTERRDLFLGTAAQLGTAVQNVEKDFWVCWTLDVLFNGLEVSAEEWQADHALALDCASHACLFFSNRDLGLNDAVPGRFTLTPSPAMRDAISRDYAAMSGMVFGEIVHLDAVLASAERFEQIINRAAVVTPLTQEGQR